MKLVECVPNFSAGKDRATVDAIAAAVRSVGGVELLDVDPGSDANRTVVTFIGPPEPVLEAAFAAISVASELIDMRSHQGAHARLGACDVCPFVPVREVTMAECVELAKRLGARVADELRIPIYLYERAASRPERRNLADVRAGEYEGLAEKLNDPAWAPDFGEARVNPKSGATVVGAREFLIAYNFNLNTRDRRIAHDIALEIREAGRAERDEHGRIVRDKRGRSIKRPGTFKHVKAVGWYLEDFGCAQISMNLTDYKKTPLAEVFDEVCRLATERGVRCTGSELVGLIPKDCLVQAGKHFLAKAGKSPGQPEKELIRLAVQSLGLGELAPFDPKKKIIENRILISRPLMHMSLTDFADEITMDSPAPGGGSVSAACGALSAALCAMAANLTVGRQGYESAFEPMKRQAEQTQALKDFFLQCIDDDAAAFDAVMRAKRLPNSTDAQREDRTRSVQQAMRKAVEVPLLVLRRAVDALRLAEAAVALGNRAALSDAGVSGSCARAAAEGAFYNVAINLAGVDDRSYVASVKAEAQQTLVELCRRADKLNLEVQRRLLDELVTEGEASSRPPC